MAKAVISGGTNKFPMHCSHFFRLTRVAIYMYVTRQHHVQDLIDILSVSLSYLCLPCHIQDLIRLLSVIVSTIC